MKKFIFILLSLCLFALKLAACNDLIMPHHDQASGKYYNSAEGERNHFCDTLKIGWASKVNAPEYYSYENQINEWVSTDKPLQQSVTPVITWIGHASFLIQINGINILTDPLFGNFSFLYPRNAQPGILPADLPPIDVVIISHTHRDHMDKDSLSLIAEKNPNALFLVPMGNKSLLTGFGCSNVVELMWWDKYDVKKSDSQSLTFTSVPAIHWCQRSLFDFNTSLWGGWMIQQQDFKIYFAGDSAYGPHFAQIAQKFGSIDVALLPIGPNEPRDLTMHSHVSTQEACQAFLDVKARVLIPMHWGTFKLGTDTFDGPIKILQQWWQEHTSEVSNKQLSMIKFGQHLEIEPQ